MDVELISPFITGRRFFMEIESVYKDICVVVDMSTGFICHTLMALDLVSSFVKDVTYVQLLLPCFALLSIVFAVISFAKSGRRRRVFLVDFACYKPPMSHAITSQEFLETVTRYCKLPDETIRYIEGNIQKTGIGDGTYFPRGLLTVPITDTIEEARYESEWLLFGAVEELFAKTGLTGADIGILVVNSTVFNPEPSLSAMIVNKFKLRDTVKSFDLHGMGCTAGLSAVGLVKNLLQVHEETYALVVSTEILSICGYKGSKSRSMLIGNCIFRSGAAAILLSNRRSDRKTAKYELVNFLQTNTSSSDQSYNCIFREEDADGVTGVSIRKDLIIVAGTAIKNHIAQLGRLVLPLSEQLRYVVNHLMRRYKLVANLKPYTPDFKKAVDHVLSHVGGKPVLDELEKSLSLSQLHMEPSRMALYRFGNTSSSAVWYALAYSEAKGRVKKGDRVWQMAFGSGFKCGSLIWKAMRRIDWEERNPWSDEIHKFPVALRTTQPLTYFNSNQPEET